MLLRYISVVIILVVAQGCDGLIPKKEDPEQLIEQERSEIDWSTIDTYPLFSHCDEMQAVDQQKTCFVTTLKDTVQTRIQKHIVISDTVVDFNFNAQIAVNQNGQIIASDYVIDQAIINKIPEIEMIVQQSFDALPMVSPALKRGIPVKLTFELPVRIRTDLSSL